MKILSTLFTLLPSLALAQSLVYTTPQNRTGLLEEFTGVNCGYCPEGHAIAASLENTLKDRFVSISVHAGGYAVPSNGQPDFRTDDGAAIDEHFTVGGYPAGAVNRHVFDGEDDLGRGAWEGAINEMLALPSPVNVGVESSYNESTHEVTIHAVAHYTASSAGGNDFLTVLIKENHIIGWQTDYGNGNQPNYEHMHVLRDIVNTDTWGDDIGSPAAGASEERTYTYTIPEEWVVENLEVVAFVGEYQSDVYQACEVPLDGGTTLVIGGLTGDPTPYRPGVASTNTVFANSFTNDMGSEQQFQVSFLDTYAPYGWATSFDVNGTEYSGSAVLTVANGGQISVNTKVTPNGNAGVSHYELRIASVSTPNAPALVEPVHVISGVHDLIVTNPQAEAHEAFYWDGLWSEPAKGFVTRADYLEFAGSNALDDVYNLYFNISWTFPSYNDAVANALATFLDNGGNLMIAGQDVGWDQSGATGSYGTPVTQAFYTNYLLADFIDDGSTADNQANFEAADAIFGSVGSTSIVNIFGGANQYPDRFDPIAPAVPILRYNDPAKIGGLRAQADTYKLVYFGIGPEQVGDENIAHLMVQLSHDWFYGVVGEEEFDVMMSSLGQPWPSPANEVVNIPVGAVKGEATLEVFDATGRMVSSQRINTAIVQVDVQELNNGLYSARVRTADGSGMARTFEVAR